MTEQTAHDSALEHGRPLASHPVVKLLSTWTEEAQDEYLDHMGVPREPVDLGSYDGPHGWANKGDRGVAYCRCGWHPYRHHGYILGQHLADFPDTTTDTTEHEEHVMTENTTTQTPDETPGVDWSAGELRALAAEVVYRYGVSYAHVEETNDDYREVARDEWGDHREPTDAELDEVRTYMLRAVIDIDGMRYGEEDAGVDLVNEDQTGVLVAVGDEHRGLITTLIAAAQRAADAAGGSHPAELDEQTRRVAAAALCNGEVVPPEDHEETVAGCSCGMADYGAPGHEGHPDFDGDELTVPAGN